MSCPIIFNSNTIELTMHTSCSCLELTVLLYLLHFINLMITSNHAVHLFYFFICHITSTDYNYNWCSNHQNTRLDRYLNGTKSSVWVVFWFLNGIQNPDTGVKLMANSCNFGPDFEHCLENRTTS